jgi:hypothetical protein
MLEGGSKSQLRGEVEDGLVDDIEDVLSGELEYDEIVERVSSGSDEVWTCVKVDVLSESGGSHSGHSPVTVVPIPGSHINGVSTPSLLTRRAEVGTHRNLSTESHKPEMSSCVIRSRCSPSCKPPSLHNGTRVRNPLAEKAVPSPAARPSISTEKFACSVPTSPKTATASPASTQPRHALASERIDRKGQGWRSGRTSEDKLDAVAVAERPHGGSSKKEHAREGILLVRDPRPAAVGDPLRRDSMNRRRRSCAGTLWHWQVGISGRVPGRV